MIDIIIYEEEIWKYKKWKINNTTYNLSLTIANKLNLTSFY
jgi:hypothetical protein